MNQIPDSSDHGTSDVIPAENERQEKRLKGSENQKHHKRICIWAGLIAGGLADGYLRLISGDEGNLLVHTAVFLGSAAIAALIVKAFFYIRDRS